MSGLGMKAIIKTRKSQPRKRTKAELSGALAFRESLVPRADGFVHGAYPYWMGWAIYEAYLAGFDAGRKMAKP